MEGNITRMELDKLVADENKAGNEADGCEEVRSSTTDGTRSMDSPTVEDTKDNSCSNEASPTPNVAATGPKNFPHSKPVSFASILDSEQVNKKLNFRSFVNEERVENSDTVLPKAAMESVKNRHDLLQCPKHVKETVFNDPSKVGTSTTMETSSDGFTEKLHAKK
ncbi:hypothetical protein Tco_1200545 [Tanacetum coccineum]